MKLMDAGAYTHTYYVYAYIQHQHASTALQDHVSDVMEKSSPRDCLCIPTAIRGGLSIRWTHPSTRLPHAIYMQTSFLPRLPLWMILSCILLFQRGRKEWEKYMALFHWKLFSLMLPPSSTTVKEAIINDVFLFAYASRQRLWLPLNDLCNPPSRHKVPLAQQQQQKKNTAGLCLIERPSSDGSIMHLGKRIRFSFFPHE